MYVRWGDRHIFPSMHIDYSLAFIDPHRIIASLQRALQSEKPGTDLQRTAFVAFWCLIHLDRTADAERLQPAFTSDEAGCEAYRHASTGLLHARNGYVLAAVRAFDRARRALEVNDELYPWIQLERGECLRRLGDTIDARRCFDDVLNRRKGAAPAAVIHALMGRCGAWQQEGDSKSAADDARRALRLVRSSGQRGMPLLRALLASSMTRYDIDPSADIRDDLDMALHLAGTLHLPLVEAEIRLFSARVDERAGRRSAARTALLRMAKGARKDGQHLVLVNVLVQLARLEQSSGNDLMAVARIHEAIDASMQAESVDARAVAVRALADVCSAIGDYEQAYRAMHQHERLREAIAVLRHRRDADERARIARDNDDNELVAAAERLQRTVDDLRQNLTTVTMLNEHRADVLRELQQRLKDGEADKGMLDLVRKGLAMPGSARVSPRGVRTLAPALEVLLAVLTPAERELCMLICDGLSTGACAERLHIGEVSVKEYRHRIRKKLHLRRGERLEDVLHRFDDV